MFDVITVGSNTVDVFAKTDSELIEIKTKNSTEELIAYPLGAKIVVNELEFQIGGGGTNTAVSFSRLGLKTAYLGKIGKDENGLKIFKLLKDENIEFIGPLGDISGYSIILDSIEEDRTILTYKGCNNDLTFKEINKRNLHTKWFYFSTMIKTSYKTLEQVSDYASKNGIKIAFNPSCYLADKGLDALKNVLNKTSVLILNLEEAELLVGKGTKESLLKKLKLPNMDAVVITDDSKGAVCFDGTFAYYIKPKKVKITETTGAGDAFASTFVSGLIMGKSTKECLKMAAINAESVIQNCGAKNILLKKRKIVQLLNKDRRSIIKKKI